MAAPMPEPTYVRAADLVILIQCLCFESAVSDDRQSYTSGRLLNSLGLLRATVTQKSGVTANKF